MHFQKKYIRNEKLIHIEKREPFWMAKRGKVMQPVPSPKQLKEVKNWTESRNWFQNDSFLSKTSLLNEQRHFWRKQIIQKKSMFNSQPIKNARKGFKKMNAESTVTSWNLYES